MIDLHDGMIKLASLRIFLIWISPKLNRPQVSTSKLTSLRFLSLAATSINVNDVVLVMTMLFSPQMLNMSAEGDPTQSEISKFNPLQVSDIIGNSITALPTQIGHLTALQQLVLAGNQLAVLLTKIGRLIALQQLDLSNNQF